MTKGSDGHLYLNAANFNGGTTTLTGTADAGDAVIVNVNGFTGDATVGADGAWSYTVTGLTNGENVLAIATVSDPAGNFAGRSYDFTVESTITESPISDAAVTKGSDGKLYLNAANFNGGTTTLTGTADAGDAVIVNVNGFTGDATVGADGAWSYTVTGLTNGENVLAIAAASDPAGNIAVGPNLDFTVDTTISESAVSDAAVTTGSDGRLYLNAANFNGGATTLTGTADAGDTVIINVNGVTGDATVGANGAWTYAVTGLTNGENVLAIATATDPAGNSTGSSLDFTVDTTISESAVSDAAVTTGSDGRLYLNAANFNGGTTTLTGTADAGDTVIVNVDGVTGDATVGADGAWTYEVTGLTNGENVLAIAAASDPAGNIAVGPNLDFTVDMQRPAAPTGLTDTSIANGYVNKANNTSGQTLTGSAEAGATVTVYDEATKLGTTTTNATTGAWSFNLGILSNSVHNLTATATDAAGNTGPVSTALSFTVDTVAPTAPILNNVGLTGNVWKLSGSAEAGAELAIYDGANLLGTTAAGADGAWSFKTGENNRAIRDFYATAIDAAGNVSAPAAAWYEGTSGNDVFQFASEAALASAAQIIGDGGADTIAIAAPTSLTDADFAHAQQILTLTLTGANSVALGAEATAAGIQDVVTGAGATSIVDTSTRKLTVNAAALPAGGMLTLAGGARFGVAGLQGNLNATSVSGDVFVTTAAAGGLSIATGGGDNVVDASAMKAGETLTLTGNASAAVMVGGNLSANNYGGDLFVTDTGQGEQTIATGKGWDTIVALQGGDTISVGGGGALIDVLGHASADTFAYASASDSLNVRRGSDVIDGFSVAERGFGFNDLIDLSAVTGVNANSGRIRQCKSEGSRAQHRLDLQPAPSRYSHFR